MHATIESEGLLSLKVFLMVCALVWSGVAQAQTVAQVTDEQAGTLYSLRLYGETLPALQRPISINLERVSFAHALREIARQGHFELIYSPDLVPEAKLVSIKIGRGSVAEALRAIAEHTHLRVLISPRNEIVLVRKPTPEAMPARRAAALEVGSTQTLVPAALDVLRPPELQTGTITGTVTDSTSGEPLPGVNVVIAGTQQGAATDAEGRFVISDLDPGTYDLLTSFVGYATKRIEGIGVTADDTTVVNIALAKTQVGLEQVVVVGYSTKTREQLASSVTVVDAEELEGVTTESVSTMLQGKVAGVFVTNGSGMPGNSPQVRIRGTGSITAGSSPLYVVDGVIADASVAQYIPAGSIASVTVLKDAAATALYGSRAASGVIVINTKSGQPGETQLNISSSVGLSEPTFGNFDVMNSRQLYEFYQSMGVGDRFAWFTKDLLSQNTDWMDLAFRRGLTSTINLSVSGGNERTTFFVSGGYYQEEGTLISTAYDRIAGRVNLAHDVSDRFRITAHAFGRYETRTFNETNALRQAYTQLPWDSPYNEEGELAPAAGREWLGQRTRNFLYLLKYNWSKGGYQDFGVDLKLEYDLTGWLSLSTTNRATFEYSHRETYRDARTRVGSANEGELSNADSYNNSFLTSNLLRARQDFGAHSLSGLLGFEYQQNYGRGLSGLGIGIFPGLDILSVTAEALRVNGTRNKSAFVSGFAQVNYDYKDTYFLTASFRRDGSSRFGADNRYGNFYSVAGAWMMSNEPFLQDVSALDRLKLRASYGATGNAGIGNFLWWGLYDYSAQYNGQVGSVPVRLANPDLTWEVAHTLNVGADVGLLGRVDLSIDIYQRVNTELLQNVELPKTSGFDFRTLNVGSVRNRGIELALSTVNLRGPFTWTTDVSFGLNRNEVLSLYGGRPVFSGAYHRIAEGRDIHSWYMREWAGVNPENGYPLWEKLIYDEEGNVVEVELTSQYAEATPQYVGTSTPDFTGGIRNTLQYKGLSLSVFANFVYGNEIYFHGRFVNDSDGGEFNYNQMVLMDGWSRWQEPGDQATHPKAIIFGNRNSNETSSRYLEDGSYLRVRNVTLSYSLPSSLLQRLDVRSARVYASGDNLVTFTRFSGVDPEVAVGGRVNATKYPISRTFTFGIQLGL